MLQYQKKENPLPSSYAQPSVSVPSYNKISLKGGGAKGYVYVGVAEAFEDLGMLKQIDTIAGVSVGSIGSLLLATGMSAKELREFTFKTNFDHMMHDCWFGREILNFIEYGGLHRGELFYEWFGQIIERAVGDKDATFEQWHAYKLKNPQAGLKDIIMEACNMDILFDEKFSFDSPYKKVPIRKGIRASMAFPLEFTPQSIEGHLFEDGGIQDNGPVSDLNVGGKHNPNALSIWLCSKEIIEFVEDGVPLPSHPPGGVIKQELATVESVLNTQTFAMMRGPYRDQTILVDTLGVGTLDFNLSEAKKEALAKSGYDAVMRFMKKHHYEYYIEKMGVEALGQQLKQVNLESPRQIQPAPVTTSFDKAVQEDRGKLRKAQVIPMETLSQINGNITTSLNL